MITALVLTLLVSYASVDSPESNETVIYFDQMQINEVYDEDTGNHRLDQLLFLDWQRILLPVEGKSGLCHPRFIFMIEHWIMLPDACRDTTDAAHQAKWDAALKQHLSVLSLEARAQVWSKYKYPGKYTPDHPLQPKKTKDGFYTVRIPKGWRNPSPVSVAGDTTGEHLVIKAKILLHTRTMYDPEALAKKQYPSWVRRLFVRPKVYQPHIWEGNYHAPRQLESRRR